MPKIIKHVRIYITEFFDVLFFNEYIGSDSLYKISHNFSSRNYRKRVYIVHCANK
jgi:hypothetical protein